MIGDLYHLLHAGDELAPMDEWYDEVFSPRRGILDDDYFAPQVRQASMVAIADCIVEADGTPQGRRRLGVDPYGEVQQPASATTGTPSPFTPMTSGLSGTA